jgi:propionyl-CoA synthetase
MPKTRSGKILRGTVRSLADGQPYQMPGTIEDPGVLEKIRAVRHESGARPST